MARILLADAAWGSGVGCLGARSGPGHLRLLSSVSILAKGWSSGVYL